MDCLLPERSGKSQKMAKQPRASHIGHSTYHKVICGRVLPAQPCGTRHSTMRRAQTGAGGRKGREGSTAGRHLTSVLLSTKLGLRSGFTQLDELNEVCTPQGIQAFEICLPINRSLLYIKPVDLKIHETKSVECIASVRPLQTWSSERKRKEIWMKDILLDVGRFARDKRKVTTSRSFGSGSQ